MLSKLDFRVHLSVQQLLLAALGAAGSLLVALPALAQLSNTTSTFSGQVAATCEINNLPENIPLDYRADLNYLASPLRQFDLSTNISTVRIHVAPVVAVSEPPPYASSIQAGVVVDDYASNYFVANKNVEGVLTYNVSTSEPNYFSVRMSAYTASMVGGKYELPFGNFSYRATISCLQ